MRGPLCRHPGLPEAPISSPERVRPWARDRLLLWTKSGSVYGSRFAWEAPARAVVVTLLPFAQSRSASAPLVRCGK
jgi:hypothetical protein